MYHHLPIKEVLKELRTKSSGLSKKEAGLRLRKFGHNELPETKNFSRLTIFLEQFKNPLVYILFAALTISLLTKHFIDAGIILVVVLISSIMGFLQEHKASQALFHLKHMVRYNGKVRRSGRKAVVAREKIVVGDIILLSPGDMIPADARIIEAQNLEIIEATLTGESTPSNKFAGVVPYNTPLAERNNMVYLGTVVARGKARAVVVATGQQTEFGHIATMVKETEKAKTPLQKQLSILGKIIGLILIGINIIIFVLGFLTGKPFFEMFLTSVAVVVAAVPEGLLPAMTVILAIGMQKLAKRKGLVRQMLAAETLGSVSVICADKTGTLTRGEMRVSQIIAETTRIYHDGKSFLRETMRHGETSHITALKVGIFCNNAFVENQKNELKKLIIIGDPTEKALFLAGRAVGLKKETLEKEKPRIAEIPFDPEYKFMATLHQSKLDAGQTSNKQRKEFTIYAKGAPEKILNLSSFVDINGTIVALTAARKKEIQKQCKELASSGLRVIAVAYKIEDKIITPDAFIKEHLCKLVFVGLIAFNDPIRPGAKEAVTLCQNAGIRPIIITGDNKFTAIAIARELGIKISNENILEGADLDKLTDKKIEEAVKKIVIFARVEPRHKIRIVSALQKNGEVVAMTGDGVNDAPALKKADIGVAVGSGTDIAKETADLVLLNNNFKTIVEAVRHGRITFNNIRKVVLYLLTDSFSEVVIVGGSVVLGLPLPILPAQILWIKLIEDAAPAMSLSFDEIDEDVMRDPPRQRTEPILNHKFKVLVAVYAIVMDFTLFGLFYYFWKMSNDIAYARTITFVGLGLASLFYIYAVRGLKLSILKINPFSNKFLVATTVAGLLMFIAAIYIPFFSNILHTVPLGIKEWAVLFGYAILSVVVYEVGKKFTIAKTS